MRLPIFLISYYGLSYYTKGSALEIVGIAFISRRRYYTGVSYLKSIG